MVPRRAEQVERKIRVVALSDTHGFVEQVPPEKIPPGDLLVHCGDFSVDGSTQERCLQKFDRWLNRVAKARFKGRPPLVVRGNHDRRHPKASKEVFPRSKARFFGGGPEVVTFFDGLLRVGVIPWMPSNFVPNKVVLPETSEEPVHMVLSHLPPKGILDANTRGHHCGSQRVRAAVEALKLRPKLWLFGHIHEAYGAMKTTFPSLRTRQEGIENTLCVNASMANDGFATEILATRPPMVVDLTFSDSSLVSAVRLAQRKTKQSDSVRPLVHSTTQEQEDGGSMHLQSAMS